MLEKILKEIDKLYSAKFASWSEPLIAIRDAREIIIAHMDDDKWVPVESATPDEQKEVLATDGQYVYLVEYDSDYGYGDMDGITAWMPLPEPYRPNLDRRKGEREDGEGKTD